MTKARGRGPSSREGGTSTAPDPGGDTPVGADVEESAVTVADVAPPLIPAAVAGEDIFISATVVPRVQKPSWFRRGRHSMAGPVPATATAGAGATGG